MSWICCRKRRRPVEDETTSERLLRSPDSRSESATGQTECTPSSHVHCTLSHTHSIPAVVHEVGTSTSDLSIGISPSLPSAARNVVTSTSDLIIQQDAAISVDEMDFPDQADNDDETLVKTFAGDQEGVEQIPSTAGRTTHFQLPQQESRGGADAFVLEEGNPGQETSEKYLSYLTENSVICMDRQGEMSERIQEKEEEVRRLQQEVRDKQEQVSRLQQDVQGLQRQFAQYVMNIRDDLRECVRDALVALNKQLIAEVVRRLCQESGLMYICIHQDLTVEFTLRDNFVTLQAIKELKEKIENALKAKLPEQIREGINWNDPVPCTESEPRANYVHGMPRQNCDETFSETSPALQWPASRGQARNRVTQEFSFVPRDPHDRQEDKRVWIRAIASFPDDGLVLTDAFNMSVKIVSVASGSPEVTSCFPLKDKPYGVTVLDNGETVAVTTEERKFMFLLNVRSGSEPTRVQTKKQYRGVGPGPNGSIVVSCGQNSNQEPSVDIISLNGGILQTLHTFSGNLLLNYLAVSRDDLFITDENTNSVYRVNILTGALEETMTHEAMRWPRQVAVGNDGSVLVACSDSECVLKKVGVNWRVILTGREHGENGKVKATALATVGTSVVVAWGWFGDSVLKRHVNIT